MRRVMGTEVEYGVSLPGSLGQRDAAVRPGRQRLREHAAPAGRARRAAWDFEEESPLRDARGFDLGGRSAPVAQEFIDAEEDAGMANVILPNGARLYVDHAHPEYSTPEVTNPLDIVRWDKAGELVMAEAARQAAAMPGVNAAHQPLQEQHRQQGRVLRRARELPDEPRDPVRLDRPPPHAVLRHPPGRLRRRPGRHRPGRAHAPASRSPSGPTSSRSRSASRPRSSARSSTPATSRTPTPSATAGCT